MASLDELSLVTCVGGHCLVEFAQWGESKYAIVWLDHQGGEHNVIDKAFGDALDQALAVLRDRASELCAAVFSSRKSTFLVGADVNMFFDLDEER